MGPLLLLRHFEIHFFVGVAVGNRELPALDMVFGRGGDAKDELLFFKLTFFS